MFRAPLKGGVLISATRECEFGPALNFERLRNFLRSIIRINLDHFEHFRLICSGLVIHNQIHIDGYAVLLTLSNGLHQFLLGAIFGSYGTLLIKFAQIVQIIYTITCIFC
ncbi:hypothetical protein D3C76_1201800 [compost metagenome]